METKGITLPDKNFLDHCTRDGSKLCVKCGKSLKNKRVVWLEQDCRTNLFYPEGIIKEENSMGMFAFGSECAKPKIKEIVSKKKNKCLEIYEYLKLNQFPVGEIDLKNFENFSSAKQIYMYLESNGFAVGKPDLKNIRDILK